MAKVTMLAAQPGGRPDGIGTERLELTLRLTPQGRIDLDATRQPDGAPWPVHWTASDGTEHAGELVRLETGWALREHPGDDDPLWRFEPGVLRPGESVTLREPDGRAAEFRVVAVEQD